MSVQRVSKPCVNCGRIVHKRPSEARGQFFCDRGCYLRHNRINLPKSIAEEYRQGKTSTEIAEEHNTTGRTVLKRLRDLGVRIRTKAERMLSDANPTKGKGHSPETIEKIRQATIKQFSTNAARKAASHRQYKALKEGKIPVVSKIENDVADVLDSMGVEYKRQHALRGPTGRFVACPDFFLIGYDAVIEVNGTFYHTDPRQYPDGPEHTIQQHNQQKYRKKCAHYKNMGINLIEIWEIDIRADTKSAVESALFTGGIKEKVEQ